MKDIATKAQLNATIANPTALIKFSAEWCGPCKAVAPVVEKIAAQYPTVECGAVDIDKAQDIARDYGVSAVPTFIFFQNGKPVETIKGANAQAVQAAFAKYGASGAARAMPKSGGNILSAKGAAKRPTAATGNQLVDWIILYIKSLFSLDARAAA